MTRELKIATLSIGSLSGAVVLAALAAGMRLFYALSLGAFALIFMAWAGIFVWMLFSGAQGDNNDVPASSARVATGNERYPRLRAVQEVSENHGGLGSGSTGEARPFTKPAAKGFDRDRCIGRDVLSRAEREWTQPVNPWGMN